MNNLKAICLLLATIISIVVVNAEINLQELPALPNVEEIEVLRERCEKKGSKDAYENFKSAKNYFQDVCLKEFGNFTGIKERLEEAQKTGSMDEVFNVYCKKRSMVKECILNVTDTVQPCMEDLEKEALNLTMLIVSQMAEFICQGDGNRLAMFVAEGGEACLKSNVDEIKGCINNTFKINTELIGTNFLPTSLPTSLSSLPAFPDLLIDRKKCDDLAELQKCVVEALEQCKDSTPANLIDALFKFVKRSACKKQKT